MKPLIGRILPLASIVALVLTQRSDAQDFFRDFGTSRSSGGMGLVTPSEYNYHEPSPSGMHASSFDTNEEQYNFAIGNLRFAMAAGLGLEFNDNVTLSENHRESDFVLRPMFNIEASMRLSDLNTLRFSLGASYAKYFDHSELDSDGVLLSPNSEIALGFQLGVFHFTVRDRLSYQEDTYDVPQLSGVPRYRRFENQAGIKADWAINEALTLSLGYDHFNLWVRDDFFKPEERSIDTILVTPMYQLTPTIKVGVNASWSFIDFDSESRADGDNFMVGPVLQWDITNYLRLYLEAGYQQLKYDGDTTFDPTFFGELTEEEKALFKDSSDSNSFYVKFEIENRPTDYFSHKLTFTKTSEVGFGSNYYELYHVEYSADWHIVENTQIGPTLFYEHYDTSGELGEKAWRIGAAIGLRHNLTNSITLGLDYRFILKDSNIEGADYYQNLVFLSAYYKF